MHDAYTPTFFNRHKRFLRGVMVGSQAWFVASDIARLVAYRFPHTIQHRFYAHEVCTLALLYSTGAAEDTAMLSEAAVYKALQRFGHPELEALDRWFTQDVMPTLREENTPLSAAPQRVMLQWENRRLMLLNWHGGLWMRWEDVPQMIADR
jgi:prophage antirepressor-like protein